jgi:hypothetical protein
MPPHLSSDKMASLPAAYGNSEALQVAQDLDLKWKLVGSSIGSLKDSRVAL